MQLRIEIQREELANANARGKRYEWCVTDQMKKSGTLLIVNGEALGNGIGLAVGDDHADDVAGISGSGDP